MQEPIEPRGRVLVVAGSDSGGGAGIQADVKTITVLGGYAATALSAATAQNTLGVFRIVPFEPGFVAEQMERVLSDIGADAIKTGMLYSADIVRAVATTIERLARSVPLVVDPVFAAKDGSTLSDAAAQSALVDRLLPLAALITPNVPEAQALSGVRIRRSADLERAADRLIALGASAVLLKGGHLEGERIVDLLRTADGDQLHFEHDRIVTRSTHGTGCTLASAVATGIAEGFTLRDAVSRAEQYVLEAIRTAPGLGGGHGPLNHAHSLGARLN